MATDYAQMDAAELLRRAAGAEGIADVLPDAMVTRMRELGGGDDGPVFRYLDCSTCHVTEEEADELGDGRGASIIPHEYGAFVRVPADDDDDADSPYPDLPNVCAALRYARTLGCTFVNFDRDGAEHDALPRYDW